MIKKMTYILIPACMSLSVAMADTLPSNQLSLSSEQMDQVTAGSYNASVNTDAKATGSVVAITGTAAVAQTIAHGNGYIEIAAGGAVAAGDGYKRTTVTPTTSQPAGSYTLRNSGGATSSLANIKTATVVTIIK